MCIHTCMHRFTGPAQVHHRSAPRASWRGDHVYYYYYHHYHYYCYDYHYHYYHSRIIVIVSSNSTIIIIIISSSSSIIIIIIISSSSIISCSSTPSPPTKSFPAKSPRVVLSGRLPTILYRHENSHPLEVRVCLSQNPLEYKLLVGGLGVSQGPDQAAQHPTSNDAHKLTHANTINSNIT